MQPNLEETARPFCGNLCIGTLAGGIPEGSLGAQGAQGVFPCPRGLPRRGVAPRAPGSRDRAAWHSLGGRGDSGSWRESGNYRSFGGGLPQTSPTAKFLEFPGLIPSPDFTPMICCHCPVPKPWPHRQTDIGKQTDPNRQGSDTQRQADCLTVHINSANIY